MIFFNNRGVVIDEAIKNAIQKAFESFSSLSEASRMMGIDRGSLAFLKGVETRKAKIISFSTWAKLSPFLQTLGGLELKYKDDILPPGVPSPSALLAIDKGSPTIEFVTSSPKRLYWEGVPHSSPSSSEFLSRLMSSKDIPAEVKVLIFQEHENFLSDTGNKRQDKSTNGNIAQISTSAKDSAKKDS